MRHQTEAREALGPPVDIEIPQEGEAIRFRGWTLGTGEVRWGRSKKSPPEKRDRGTGIRILLREDGTWFTEVRRWRPGEPEHVTAATFEGPSHVLQWLRGGGELGQASLGAWMEACRTLPSMAKMAEERIP